MSRPAPQYGEYATPEEVAALRGTPVEPPAPVPPAPGARPAPSTRRRLDRPVTIALIVLGVFNLIQYAGPLFDFEAYLELATADTPYAALDFGPAARTAGIVLFAVSALLVVASALLAVAAMRRGRLAFWIPLTGAALTLVAWVVTLTVILFDTPGALVPLGG